MDLRRHTLETCLNAANGKPSGFDYMRFCLATLIICLHTLEISYGSVLMMDSDRFWWRCIGAAVLPMFFALSGFLVAGSLERTSSITTFMALRGLRILPALCLEVLVWALIFGPLLTELSFREYFSDPELLDYFKNIIGAIQYTLPGLFADNPMPRTVNAQLWTLPYELMFYALVVIIALPGIYRRKYGFAFFVALVIAALSYLTLFKGFEYDQRPGVVPGYVLVMSALAGMLLFRFREIIPNNFLLFIVSLTLGLCALSSPDYDVLSALPIAYATVYLGLLNPARDNIILSGDYSYGLFLYGYPIQQFVASFAWTHEWYINFAISFPLIFFAAFCSWWLVEKPALALRRLLPDYRPVTYSRP